jgi:hypothetical protein
MDNNELYHYGVKGMKWGVRKKTTTFDRDGSERTIKKLNKFLDADARYGANRTFAQNRKVNKLYKQYDKSAAKDIKAAAKQNNAKAVNSITAGRTYLKMMMDSNYLNRAITDTSIMANVEIGKDFAYNVTRDDSSGGVKVTVNNVSNTYAYAPELKKKG